MTVKRRLVPRKLHMAAASRSRNSDADLFPGWWRTAALLALIAFISAIPAWAQNLTLTASNQVPLEGPGAGTDIVLISAGGLPGTGNGASVTTDSNWITILSTTTAGSNTMNLQNGPNRLKFQFSANTGATRQGTITLQLLGNSATDIFITVTQAGAGFVPAGPVTLTTGIIGPEAIDVDPQGNLFILEVSGKSIFEWTSATQQLSKLATASTNTYVDVAVDGPGDVFALEYTTDNMYGTQVQAVRSTQAQIPQGGIIFSSEANAYLFPAGVCVDSAGANLHVTTVDVSNKCLIDQFGTVYELDSTSDNEDLGYFKSPPSTTKSTPTQLFFPYGTYVDACGNQLSGVSGSLYGLSKDGSGFIYFTDHNGARLNRYDPTTPWYTCGSGGFDPSKINPSATFTTLANLTFPAYYTAADATGNIYLSVMAFSLVQELPRAYVSTATQFNEPVSGGTDTIQILPANQNLTGVFAPKSSDTSWLNVTSVVNGGVTFTAAPNPGPIRTGFITILGVPVKVVQGESQTPVAMSIVAGNNQTTAVGGSPYPINLLVKVTNQWGDAAANVPVNFLSPGFNSTVNTDLRGYAAVTGVFANTLGQNNVYAVVPGTIIHQVFNMMGVQSGISVVSGSNQQVEELGEFAPLTVQVLGTNGQPMQGVPVTFTAPASGASGIFQPAGAASVTATTNSVGTVSTLPNILIANTVSGSYLVSASIGGVPGVTASSCNFNLTNFGPVQELVSNQNAPINGAYASPLSVKVVDSNGNPVAGASVQFTVGIGGANGQGAVFSDGTQATYVNTGANGIATALSMNATATAGPWTAQAVVNFPSGGSLAVAWTLTNLPSTILEGAVLNGPTTRTLAQPLVVKASPNAIAGTMVFTVVPGSSGAGGSFNGQSSASVNLDSQGYGTSPLITANSTPGVFTVTAFDGAATVQSTVTTTPCLNPNSISVVVTDTQDYNPQSTSPDTGSLRYALTNACAGSTLDLSQLTGVIALQSRLRIDDNMTVTGLSPDRLAIDGGNKTRLFFIGNGLVTLFNLTLQNGLAQGGSSTFGGGGSGMGGAIFMQGGSVVLGNVNFIGNQALGGNSGTAQKYWYGGGGFGGNAPSAEQGGGSADLFGLAGLSNGASGDIGGGGAGTGVFSSDSSANGGNGGFGAGGGAGHYNGGLTSSGNGGFGGGGAGGLNSCNPSSPQCPGQVMAGTGGYGAGAGYAPGNSASVGVGGSGAGFGGAIFEYSGQLVLSNVLFANNAAVGGTLLGLSGQPALTGQGKGGALFIYSGAVAINNQALGATFGTGSTANVAAAAGLPGNGNSAAPYTNGAICPGRDTVDVCGNFGSPSATVNIAVPTGSTFSVAGMTYSGSQTLNLPQGQYTLAALGPQATGVGTQVTFASWSDGGAAAHTITVGSAGLSITGTFVTQYLLTISAGSGGLTVPSTGGYYNAGTVVNLSALPNVGSVFSKWTGPVAAAGSVATTVTMNSPQTVGANFAGGQKVNVSIPANVSFTLNGVTYTGPNFVSLAPGQYALSTTSPQLSSTGDQQSVFSAWSDGGALSHTITVGSSNLSVSGSFNTLYLLTANAGNGGTISPVNGFYSAGMVVNLTATPNPGYVFKNWTGIVASPASATTTVTISQAATATANFSPAPAACVATPANVSAWWKGENTANDEVALHNATLGGDVTFAQGMVGKAFSFDGTQSPFVSIPAGVFPPQPGSGAFSFEAWFQTSGGNGGVILGQQSIAAYGSPQNGWSPAIYVGTDGNLYVEMFYNGTTNQLVGPVLVNDNHWHHVAVTYDGSSEIAYLDGTNIGQALSFTQVANGLPLSYQLGTGYTANYQAANGAWYTFNGLIDEPAVYSRALTAAEVLGIDQAGSYGKCDPVAAINPSSLAFPNVTAGQNITLSSQVTNSGNAPLNISSIALDTNDVNFTVLTGNPGDCAAGTPVAAGASCSLRVQFAQRGTGSLSGQITITDNSVFDAGVQTLALSGAGLAPGTLILAASPTVTFQADPVLLTATINGNPVPTGTVTFFDATTALGTAVLKGSGVATLTATALTVGTHSLTAQYSGSKNYAAGKSNTAAVTINPSAGPPTAVSVTPNVGSGAIQTFSAVYSDPNGAADLSTVRLLFNTTANGAHACYVQYSPAANLLYLENDANTATLAGITPGSSATVSNSQCTLNAAGSSYNASGNTATLSVALTFTSALPTNIYLYAGAAANSGWVQKGTWNSAGPPTAVSVTPNVGSGAIQTFSAVYSDPNGAADLSTVRLLFNTAASGANACYVQYSPAANLLYLENDANTATLAGITPGSSATVSNSQCALNAAGSSYNASGNTATLSVALTFTSALPTNIYLYAGAAANSGWVQKGTWNSAGPPTAVSVTPNVGSGAIQTFSAVYSDPNGAADLSTVRLLFNTTASGAHACYVQYSPAVNLLYLENDANTATLAGITPGSSATVSNSQCTLNAAGSSYNASGNTATLSVALTLTSALPTNIYLYAGAAANSGWVQKGTWNSAGPPTAVSVTPNVGSGAIQTFSAVYSDPNGAADLSTVRLLFNTTASGANACYVQYSPAANLLYLENDANTATLAGITPGSSATVSNSQCALNAAGSSYNASGNTATLSVALKFSSTLPENIYLYAGAAANSGWVQKGTWNSAGPPTAVSVTPNVGSGAIQTFSAVYSDPNGAADLSTVRLLFNTTASGANACYVQYSPAANLLYLENDANTATLAGITPGSSATVSNSQCTLNAAGSSYNASGNTATLSVALKFSSALPTNIYLYAGAAANSGWVQKGTWNSAGPPTAVSVTPNVGSGAIQTFSAVYSDPNGAADLSTVRLLFNTTASGANACYVQYSPAVNLLYLENDANTATLAGITPGSSATVSNSQCALNAAGSSYNASGNTATLSVALTLTSALPTNIYLYAGAAANSGWVQKGTWNSAGPPTAVSVTPNVGSGATQTFSAVYSDPNGAADLSTVRLLFNTTASGANACYVQYSPAANLLYLENDANTATLAGITPGSSATVSNSQCALNAAGSSYNASGNTATLSVALTLTSALPTNIYLYAGAAANSGWVQKGTWNSAGPPTAVSVTPNVGSGATQTFSAVYSDPNGAADLSTVRLLFNTTASGANACYVQYSPAANLLYLENDANTATLAGITPGSSATVSNSQCALNAAGSSYNASGNTATLSVALKFSSTLPENIYLYAGAAANSGWVQKGTWNSAGPPTAVSVTPNVGSGAIQTFSAVYSDPNGAADLSTVRLLFNTTASGANACYVQYSPAANLLYLENDANTATLAGITPGSSATVSNSQCALNAAGSSYNASGNTATLSVALTLTSALPTNIYLYAGAAANSGWVQKGTWNSAGPPTAVSVTPNVGSGAIQTFSAVYSDPNGAADLSTVRLLFNTTASGANACYVQYSPAANLLYLENDANTATLAGITPGSSATVSNSQCALNAAGSSYNASGNTATLSVALTLTSALPTNIYLYAGAAANSGWVQKGTWNSAGPPTAVSVTPNVGSGAIQTFSAVYSDPNGAADLSTVRLLFNTTASGANACYVQYSPAANLLYLENDANTATLAGITPGSSATVSNSQCALNAAGSSYNASGNTATLSVALKFSSTLPENIYLYAGAAANSGWVQKGTWNSAGPPTAVSVTPNVGSGAIQTFSAVYSDPNGAADLSTVRLLFNTTASGAHACYVQYSPAVNLLYLENDANTATLAGITPGSSATVSNSQCTLNAAGSSYNASGNTATLSVALKFSSTLPENIYSYAAEANGTAGNNGWPKMGTWLP